MYQEISGDISWSAVNGYYGLAKDAYPSLNPRSSGALAVSSWTKSTSSNETNNWRGVCWSPELRLFVAVASGGTNRVMTSPNGINWTARTPENDDNNWISVCWSPELRIFVAVASGGTNLVMTSPDGITWTGRESSNETNTWFSVCWSSELGIFAAVSLGGTNQVMTSPDGTTWTGRVAANESIAPYQWFSICWSPQLGLFAAVAQSGTNDRVMTSPDGINWTSRTSPTNNWESICWSPELGLFAAVAWTETDRVMTSPDGINWTGRVSPSISWDTICWCNKLGLFVALAFAESNRVMTSPDGINWTGRVSAHETGFRRPSVCWSPELGLVVAVYENNTNRVMISSLKGRPPTSYNLFDSSFNSIDETGKWDFSNIAVTTLTVTGSFTNTSDDRLKHNEVVIANGLEIIDKLNPKFYQKTQVMLDTSYNGDLSGQAWTYEAGLIAQELLQIPDLSFAVSGGDYYQESYILKNQSNDLSNVNYDPCGNYYYPSNANYYDMSANYINRANYYDTSANYDISYNLIAQPYSLNYTSIYVYVFAAIKELHAKVKAQETAIYNRQAIINNCITRIETLEQRNQV